MAVKPVLICDVCGSDNGVQASRVVFPDGMVWEVDLCPKDCGKLQEFRDRGWGHEVKGRGRRRTFEVTTIESIQMQGRKRV